MGCQTTGSRSVGSTTLLQACTPSWKLQFIFSPAMPRLLGIIQYLINRMLIMQVNGREKVNLLKLRL